MEILLSILNPVKIKIQYHFIDTLVLNSKGINNNVD